MQSTPEVHRYVLCKVENIIFGMFLLRNRSVTCADWICYAEKTHGSDILLYISAVKSTINVGKQISSYSSNVLCQDFVVLWILWFSCSQNSILIRSHVLPLQNLIKCKEIKECKKCDKNKLGVCIPLETLKTQKRRSTRREPPGLCSHRHCNKDHLQNSK